MHTIIVKLQIQFENIFLLLNSTETDISKFTLTYISFD